MSVNNTTMSINNSTLSVNNTTISVNNTTPVGAPWPGFPWGNITTTTPIPIGDPIVYCCWYWSGLYYFYILIIVLFCVSMISLAIGARRRVVLQRQARQRAQANGNSGSGSTTLNGSTCTNSNAVPKPADAPPSYDDAVQNYINAKQQLQAAEEGAMTGSIPLAASTTTMETVVETGASVTDLSHPSITPAATTTTTTINPTQNSAV